MWEITKFIVGYYAEQYRQMDYPTELNNLACCINKKMSAKPAAADLKHQERKRVLGD